MAQIIQKSTTAGLITLTLLLIGTSSQPDDCTAEIVSLGPCIDYITGGSSTPSAPCCLQFATVVKSEPRCLCVILSGGGGIDINKSRALALPDACNVQTPPVSQCNAAAVPLPSVTPSSGGNSNGGDSPSGGGNSNGGDSAGCFLRPVSFLIIFSIVTIVMAFLSMPSIEV